MRTTAYITLVTTGLLALLEGPASACGTCALDSGGPGQVLMLVGMIATPLVIAGIGYGVIRRLITKAGTP